MRIAYLLHWMGGSESGVFRKVDAQARAWQAAGCDASLFLLRAQGSPLPSTELPLRSAEYCGFRGRFAAVASLVEQINDWSPDIVYLRQDLYYPALSGLRSPIAIEVNSHDLKEYAAGPRGRYFYHRLTRGRLFGLASGIVYVAHGLALDRDFRALCRPGIVIPNGIDLNRYEPLPLPSNARPRLAFMGTPGQRWHGADKIARLAAETPDWDYILIGPNADEAPASPSNVKALGYLKEEEYRRTLAECDAAIGSLAMDRAGVAEGSPLKVREYLALGLPTLIAYRDSDFLGGAEFLLELPLGSEPIDHLPKIRRFVEDWQGRRVERCQIQHLDWAEKEERRLAFFRSLSSPKKILFVSTGLDVGGAETQLFSLATGLNQRGWSPWVVSLLPPGPIGSELLREDVPVASLEMRRRLPDPRAIARLARCVRSWRPNIAHSHQIHANLLSRIARVFARQGRLVCTAHSMNEGGRLRMAAYRMTERLCDVTTIISQAAADAMIDKGGASAGKLRVIPNGVDTERFGPIDRPPNDDFVWVALCRLDAAKDIPTMLKAARIALSDKGRLLIAGDGPLKAELATMAIGMGAKVQFVGTVSDSASFLQAADGFLMSSAWEGLPMALLEAAATGLPIASTSVGGIPEVVEDGLTGLLSLPGDAEALAANMDRVMSMAPAEREAMGKAARERVIERFSLRAVLDQWEALYDEIDS